MDNQSQQFFTELIQKASLFNELAESISVNCKQFFDYLIEQIQVGLFLEEKESDYFLKAFQTWFPMKKVKTQSCLCSKIFSVNDYAFQCVTCSKQINSIICIQCFNKSDHQGHLFMKKQTFGGCCDCGDEQMFDRNGFCSDHRNKNLEIVVEKQQEKRFISEMKFVIKVAKIFTYLKINKLIQMTAYERYMQNFLDYMIQFNQDSLYSNQMTSSLFWAKFSQDTKQAHYFPQTQTTFQILSENYKLQKYSQKFVNLCIMLFTRPNFKKRLTEQYNKLMKKHPQILLSNMQTLTDQVFNNKKIISQLISQEKFLPISIGPINGQNIQNVCKIYLRFYTDMKFLANLHDKEGEKYINYHFTRGNITELSGYDKYCQQDMQTSISFFGIQYYYLLRSIEYLSSKLQKETIRKCVFDLLGFLREKYAKNDNKLNILLPKERTLIILLFILFQGNLGSSSSIQILNFFKIQESILFHLTQNILGVFRFNSVVLSNTSSAQRYGTYNYFTFYEKGRIVSSVDSLLLKFCFLSIQGYILPQIEQYRIQQNLSYNFELNMRNNMMPMNLLLSVPLLLVENVNKNVIKTNDGNYDRKKALRYATEYVGLLIQSLGQEYSYLYLLSNFMKDESKKHEEKFFQFYGQILKNVGQINIDKFINFVQFSFGQKKPFFEQFVKQFCIMENKKVLLKKELSAKFVNINLSYLKSFKYTQIMKSCSEKVSQAQLSYKFPNYCFSEGERRRISEFIFDDKLIDRLTNPIQLYCQLYFKEMDVFVADQPHFQAYIQQIAQVFVVTKLPEVATRVARILNKNQEVYSILSRKTKIVLSSILSFTDNQQKPALLQCQKNIKIKELKQRKLQKIKIKQNHKFNYFVQNQQKEQKNTEICMFCKENTQQSLMILCYGEKSNLIHSLCMGLDQQYSIMIYSCGHYTHKSCLGLEDKIRRLCYFCKTYSNILIPRTVSEENKEFFISQLSDRISEIQLMEQNKNKLNPKQKIVQVISHLIAYGVFVEYSFFEKSLHSVVQSLFCLVQNQMIDWKNLVVKQEKIPSKTKQNDSSQLCRNVFNKILLTIISFIKNATGQQKLKQNVSIPQEIQNILRNIFQSIRSSRQSKISDIERPIMPIKTMLKLFDLPQNLDGLTKYLGPCPQCKRLTNQICVCLICSKASCFGCENGGLLRHSLQQHKGNSVFIRVDNGSIIYFGQSKLFYFPNLYENIIGQSFVLQKQKPKSEYILKISQLKKVTSDIIRHRIFQQIIYSSKIKANEIVFNNE